MTTIHLLLLVCLGSSQLVSATVQNIKIGVIFHEGDEEMEAAFDDALRDLDSEQNAYFNLRPIKRRLVDFESYKVLRVSCELLEEGVAVIFGPRNFQSRSIVSNVAAHFNVPHIEYSFKPLDPDMPVSFSINVYPSTSIFEKVVAEVVRHMKWQAYTFVYQSYDAFSRIQEAFENKGRPNYPIIIRDIEPLYKINQLLTQKERDTVYESLVKEIKLASQYSLLLDVETANLGKLLEVMRSMGLMTDYFMCFIIDLEASRINIADYLPSDTVANVTHFRFIQDDSMSVEASLLYDAVFAFSEALSNLFKEAMMKGANIRIRPKPMKCHVEPEKEIKYDLGLNITSLFLKKTRYGRKTGLMTFNPEGERNFDLDVMSIQGGRTSKVGEWRDGSLRLSLDEKEINNTLTEAVKSKIFKVTTRVGPPYVALVEDDRKGRAIGDKKYEGYCIDLIAKIEEFLGIHCEFELVPDTNYGSLDPRTKKWNGIIQRLLEHKADMGICDLTITSERQSAVDFTAPFMNLGISILFSKPGKVVPKLFAFMDPLSTEVWLYMATAYLIVTLMLFLQARMAPGEWINPHPCNPEPEELENNFTLMNSFWLTMGSLMQQGSDILPLAPSIRMVVSLWWFFVLIMVSSYTANLAAFLTAVKMDDQINDVEDLAKQTKISYGALKDGSTYSFFKNSNTTLYQRLFNTMSDTKPSVFTASNMEGVDRVVKGRRKYAFFMESTSIEYQVERHCELQSVGALLDNKGYGIALPPNSPYRTMISTAILHLQEKGELLNLKTKWWKEKGGGLCDEVSDEPTNSNELGIGHVGGVFLVLMFGCVISIFIGIAEFLWNIREVAIEEKITPREAFMNELRFVMDVSKTTKPVKTGKSSSKSGSSRGNGRGKSQSVDGSNVSSLHRLESQGDLKDGSKGASHSGSKDTTSSAKVDAKIQTDTAL